MARSLSLAAYRALSRRNRQPDAQPPPPRPPGELVWLHATDDVRFSALRDLARRLRQMRPGIHCLMTYDENVTPAKSGATDRNDEWVMELSSDHPSAARQFLDHWSPDMCLWTGGKLLVNIIGAAADQRIPLILADVTGTEFQSGRHTWIPDLKRASYDFFGRILVNNDSAAMELKRLGLNPSKIEVTEQLRPGAFPPDCSEEDLANVMEDLGGRSVWLAVGAQKIEFDAILATHRAALRYSHRLLLIMTWADPKDCHDLLDKLARAGLRTADWDDGAEIEDNTQVVVSESGRELGLWYRSCPITFLANSLVPGAKGLDPRYAAALGSAVLYGPDVGNFEDIYQRLQDAGAARMVTGSDSLGAALSELIAPDKAAEMALAGWELVTEGADVTNQLVDLIQDTLDKSEAADARA